MIKVRESLASVLPITIIVMVLAFTISPMEVGTLGLFLIGAVMLIVGMGLFTLGADMAMMPMGTHMGAHMTKSRKLGFMVIIAFSMGMLITIAEPDLQVLAKQVPAVPDWLLIGAVALGVGIFLVIALLRIVFQKSLNKLLIVFYLLVFGLAALAKPEFFPVAFDSGGVTTGPITVPFILALGLGVAGVRGGKNSQDDSFGLVALCSIGPILAMATLGIFYSGDSMEVARNIVENPGTTTDILKLFGHAFPHYMLEVGIALSPIILLFAFFQIKYLKLPGTQILRMAVGVLYTYVGLVIFLTGVNVGFLPAGTYLGEMIAKLPYNWILIPIGMIMGYFIVSAEPAVHVLNEQVEEVTGGSISKRAMMLSLSIGVAISIGISMLRVLTGVSLWYFIVPGYAIALALSFFVPKIFTAIAFDSGGVASGPMTATFLLPFAMGACSAIGGNVLMDAFGLVAMVAMTPLITIQILGLVYALKTRRAEKAQTEAEAALEADTDEIIDL